MSTINIFLSSIDTSLPYIHECIGTTEEKQLEQIALNNALDYFNSITNDCSVKHDNQLSNGSSGIIYLITNDPLKVVKISNMPSCIQNKLNKKQIYATAMFDINRAIYENINVREYSKFREIFPYNIMDTYYTETSLKNGKVVNVQQLEKINGHTLKYMMKNNMINDIQLLEIIIQLVYITLHTNLSGNYHNDITLCNIMIKSDIFPKKITYAPIKMADFSLKLNLKNFEGIHIATLVDYGISLTNTGIKKIMEPFQVANIIKLEICNKLNLYPLSHQLCSYILQQSLNMIELTSRLELELGLRIYDITFLKNIELPEQPNDIQLFCKQLADDVYKIDQNICLFHYYEHIQSNSNIKRLKS